MKRKYEYQFDRMKLRSGFWSGKFMSEDYRDLIAQRAREGWRLAEIFSPAVAGYGRSIYADLIFERAVD